MYQATKTYGHEVGLSACFRQWRAESHCKFMHGYALKVTLRFACANHELDKNGWVINFGGLKAIKGILEDLFDHKTLVASDDPDLLIFKGLQATGLIQMVEVKNTGCEAFAKLVFDIVEDWLTSQSKAWLVDVTVAEHGANSATYGKA
jgi:6-pyruvoyltetrahydropterin/6-carboxytetrahydropterin synthase